MRGKKQVNRELKKITFKKHGMRFITIVDGVQYDINEIADFLDVASTTVRYAYHRMENLKERETWFRKTFWATENGISRNIRVFCKDKVFLTSWQIMQQTGLGDTSAIARGRKFEDGDLTLEELLKPPAPVNRNSTNRGIWGLEGRPRTDLASIPSPTKYDRKYGKMDKSHEIN